MTPTPTPLPGEAGVDLFATEVLVALVAFALLGFVLVWAVLRVSSREPAAMVTVIVGLLTFTAMVGFALSGEEVLGTLAATGLGALAGAVTNLFDRHDDDGD